MQSYAMLAAQKTFIFEPLAHISTTWCSFCDPQMIRLWQGSLVTENNFVQKQIVLFDAVQHIRTKVSRRGRYLGFNSRSN
jgi:hypothetical protein